MADFAEKLHGKTLRIAGILHISKHGNSAREKPISANTVRQAIEIGKYFLEHAKVSYRLDGGGELQKQAKYILKQLAKYPQREYIPSGIRRICRGNFKKTEDIYPALELLVDVNCKSKFPEIVKLFPRVPSGEFYDNL
jgi:hypothetical protein